MDLPISNLTIAVTGNEMQVNRMRDIVYGWQETSRKFNRPLRFQLPSGSILRVTKDRISKAVLSVKDVLDLEEQHKLQRPTARRCSRSPSYLGELSARLIQLGVRLPAVYEVEGLGKVQMTGSKFIALCTGQQVEPTYYRTLGRVLGKELRRLTVASGLPRLYRLTRRWRKMQISRGRPGTLLKAEVEGSVRQDLAKMPLLNAELLRFFGLAHVPAPIYVAKHVPGMPPAAPTPWEVYWNKVTRPFISLLEKEIKEMEAIPVSPLVANEDYCNLQNRTGLGSVLLIDHNGPVARIYLREKGYCPDRQVVLLRKFENVRRTLHLAIADTVRSEGDSAIDVEEYEEEVARLLKVAHDNTGVKIKGLILHHGDDCYLGTLGHTPGIDRPLVLYELEEFVSQFLARSEMPDPTAEYYLHTLDRIDPVQSADYLLSTCDKGELMDLFCHEYSLAVALAPHKIVTMAQVCLSPEATGAFLRQLTQPIPSVGWLMRDVTCYDPVKAPIVRQVQVFLPLRTGGYAEYLLEFEQKRLVRVEAKNKAAPLNYPTFRLLREAVRQYFHKAQFDQPLHLNPIDLQWTTGKDMLQAAGHLRVDHTGIWMGFIRLTAEVPKTFEIRLPSVSAGQIPN